MAPLSDLTPARHHSDLNAVNGFKIADSSSVSCGVCALGQLSMVKLQLGKATFADMLKHPENCALMVHQEAHKG